jgi:hypothetical protein
MPVSRIYTSRQFGTTYIQTCGIILKAHSTILSIFHLYMTSSSKQMDRNRNVAARSLNSDTYIEIEEAGSQQIGIEPRNSREQISALKDSCLACSRRIPNCRQEESKI